MLSLTRAVLLTLLLLPTGCDTGPPILPFVPPLVDEPDPAPTPDLPSNAVIVNNFADSIVVQGGEITTVGQRDSFLVTFDRGSSAGPRAYGIAFGLEKPYCDRGVIRPLYVTSPGWRPTPFSLVPADGSSAWFQDACFLVPGFWRVPPVAPVHHFAWIVYEALAVGEVEFRSQFEVVGQPDEFEPHVAWTKVIVNQ